MEAQFKKRSRWFIVEWEWDGNPYQMLVGKYGIAVEYLKAAQARDYAWMRRLEGYGSSIMCN